MSTNPMSLNDWMTKNPEYARVKKLVALGNYDEAQEIETRLITEYQEQHP